MGATVMVRRCVRMATMATTHTPARPTDTMARPGSRAASSSEPAPGMDTEATAMAATIGAAIIAAATMDARAMAMDAPVTAPEFVAVTSAELPAAVMLAEQPEAVMLAEQPEAASVAAAWLMQAVAAAFTVVEAVTAAADTGKVRPHRKTS
jgi:hypothetical protein